MISYEPLWGTMKLKNATIYTLRNKGKLYNISGSTITRLQKNQSVSTNTLETLCTILKCNIPDIIEFTSDNIQGKNRKSWSASTDHKLYSMLKGLSEKTKIPISYLLDEAIEDLMLKYRVIAKETKTP